MQRKKFHKSEMTSSQDDKLHRCLEIMNEHLNEMGFTFSGDIMISALGTIFATQLNYTLKMGILNPQEIEHMISDVQYVALNGADPPLKQ